MTKVTDELINASEFEKVIGSDDADNEMATTLVVANKDGSVLERQEYIQSVAGALTDAAADTASTATMIALLRQIAEAVNNGTGTAMASNKSVVDYIGDGSTSSLVARLGALTDVAADTASTATMIALLRQIAEAVNNGTGTAMASNKSVVDYIGDGSTSSLVARLGALTDAAADTTNTATIIALLRQVAEAVNNGAGGAIASGKSLVDYIGDSSTSSLVARLGALADVADETASTATIINLLRAVLDNRVGPRVVFKTIVFDGGAGKGAVGEINLFTITGPVKVQLEAVCTESLAEAAPGSATIQLGYTGTTTAFIAATAALDLDAGDLWFDTSPTEPVKDTATAQLAKISLGNIANIITEVAVAGINDGTLTFRCEWEPLTPTSTLVAS